MALVLLGSTGCTGSRLRNLISRNDYQSLEEINAAEAAEESTEAADTRLVSESREADADADAEESPAAEVAEDSDRGGLLNLASLFRRDKDRIAPDPFVESTEPAASATDNRVTPISDHSAEEIVRQATADSNSANAAEELIREAVAEAENAVADAAITEAEVQAEPVITPAAETNAAESTVQKSFAEFIAEQQQKNAARTTEIVESTTEAVADSANPFAEIVQQTPQTVSEFDELLQDQTEQFADQVDAADASELFPGIDALLTETQQVIEEEPSLDQFFSDTTETPTSAESDNPFTDVTAEEVAAQHGFEPTQAAEENDPWAAFQQLQASSAGAVQQGTAEVDAFAWASEPEATTAAAAPVVTAATPDESSTATPFQNVSASYEVQPAAAEFTNPPAADPAALVIPSSQPTAQETNLFTTPFDATEEDPFAEPAGADGAVVRTETAAGAPLLGGFSGRTWFLLLGLAIVAVLLFLPERQNRTDS